ncbi:MAG TPA: MBL fold metallo-hydrolase [Candidatus Acidoferrum sp.]|nr:MBL fold metallo-hydrolase [Candidatus Acidoferrum sp.]
MKVHFLGATRTTTGSMYLWEVNGKRLLLECGLFQGHREETTRRNCNFPFDPKRIDAVVLSHAHIDHAGNLPNLVKQGYGGPIHCTTATQDLCGIMLIDSAHIQEQDALFVSKWRAKKHLPPVEPLYRIADAEQAVKQLVGHDYETAFCPVDNVNITFRDGGHILGSAQVILDVQENGERFRWLFSGDVGRGADELLRDPIPVENVDYLQIESTYGNREHAVRTDADATVGRLVGETLAQRGKVIIPAFSVGRTQQIVYVLHGLTCAGKLPRVPIFVDSPLSTKASDVYERHRESLRPDLSAAMCDSSSPFDMGNLIYISEAGESKQLNDRHEPMIIISASGMAEAGRIRHHLANNIEDKKNLILFIGYCAEGTLGSQITAGKTPVNIFGEPHPVRAQVVSMDTYSGHADKHELKRYVEQMSGSFKKIFCIHGEEDSCRAHAETLHAMKPKAQVLVPEYQQVVEI